VLPFPGATFKPSKYNTDSRKPKITLPFSSLPPPSQQPELVSVTVVVYI
jgi:hypothetical protein